MSDEKWWFGLVSRTFAKMCPALGIAKEVFAVHHKNHIKNKDSPYQHHDYYPKPILTYAGYGPCNSRVPVQW